MVLIYYSLTHIHRTKKNIYTFASIFLLGFLRNTNCTTLLTTKVHLALRHYIILCKKQICKINVLVTLLKIEEI